MPKLTESDAMYATPIHPICGMFAIGNVISCKIFHKSHSQGQKNGDFMKPCIFKDDRQLEREFGKAGLLLKALPRMRAKMPCEACLTEDHMKGYQLYVASKPDRTRGRCVNVEE